MEVLAIGSKVKIKQPNRNGIILAVCIRGKTLNVSYECVWWETGTRHSKWLEDIEVHKKEAEKLKIGFQK